MQKTVHIIGAGISGLSAAVRLANANFKVHVHEATQQAGGRCRSYFDAATNLTIDNGNHLLLSGNRHAVAYARSIGTEAGLVGPKRAQFPFVDLTTGQRWQLDLGDGRHIKVGGMAKGAAMLAPSMATMLAVLTTDAAVTAEQLQSALADAVDAEDLLAGGLAKRRIDRAQQERTRHAHRLEPPAHDSRFERREVRDDIRQLRHAGRAYQSRRKERSVTSPAAFSRRPS